eukprot:CAMPEP_0176049698 /NCGR_PEP_ID=MMETSP0120_2-20121206/24696_1 /TAXON_ID=160619 /ORGANISM="Kryptoperidinium foliaceum, Strain CCMP 1326" /LENGTH=575 /DNA_ID=CAMNT_0017383125 /DNA_START=48 /DNA_END=1771 /DNA_ORIENTATION=+
MIQASRLRRAAAASKMAAAAAGPRPRAGAIVVLALCCTGGSALSASAARLPWASSEATATRATLDTGDAPTSAPAPPADGAPKEKRKPQAAAGQPLKPEVALPQAAASTVASSAVSSWATASAAIAASLVSGDALQAADSVASWVKILFGTILLLIAVPINWFNEERSARIDALLSTGLEDVVCADASAADAALRGRLVHIQGRARAMAPVRDIQFRDAVVPARCLKLQSTVEVFEWVEKARGGRDRLPRQGFDMEWTTVHRDNLQPKPSPQNPRPPSRLALGTFTQSCPRVEIGAYVLTEDMVKYFKHFQPAMHLLPERITCADLTFFANQEDGYYYGRPGLPSPYGMDRDKLLSQHLAGDIRVRFMYVPETDATVVAAQCHKDGAETFVPYRPVPTRPCTQDFQSRRLRIEEGDRSVRAFNRDSTCCAAGGLAGCCCCACNAIACVCESEVVTEEICYVSDRLEPLETSFNWVVHRSPWRVWNFRAAGLLVMFFGVRLILNPFMAEIAHAPMLAVYGSIAPLVVALAATLVAWVLILAVATAVYRPAAALRWVVVAGFILCAPLFVGSQHAAA